MYSVARTSLENERLVMIESAMVHMDPLLHHRALLPHSALVTSHCRSPFQAMHGHR